MQMHISDKGTPACTFLCFPWVLTNSMREVGGQATTTC